MLDAKEDRDKYKKEIEKLTEQLEKQKQELNNLNTRNKRLSVEVNMEQHEQYKTEINDLRKENDHLLKMLIKRCKKDVINQTRDYSPSVELKKPSPSKGMTPPVAAEKGNTRLNLFLQGLQPESNCLAITSDLLHL